MPIVLRLLPAVLVACLGAATAQQGTKNGDWRHYGGDHGATHYAPLDQVTKDNFDTLAIAWRWKTVDDQLADKTQFKPFHFRPTPLAVNGTIYLPTGLCQVAAVDAGTGETKWVFDPASYTKGMITHSMFHHRGLEYWTDGKDERLLIATGGRQLVSVDPKTGKPDPNFGVGGIVDLAEGLGRKINPRSIAHNSPVVVCRDTVVVGSIIMDFPTMKEAPPGHVRGYDVRTGKMNWIFHSIPQAGEFGNETWEDKSWEYSGNTNVWSMMSADDELGYVYLPFGTPTNDHFGGHRLGDNLFAESLVCLNAQTGERVWHFQAVHHGLWDYDFPCQPNLVDVTVNGKTVKAVAQVSKQGFTYVFDRKTGEPVWPIEERPVGKSTVPGERAAETQPFPTKPPAFERQGVTKDDLIDLTPELKAEAEKILERYVSGPIFTPPTVIGENGKQGTILLPSVGGGGNWPGASVDPETGTLYVQSQTQVCVLGVSAPDPARSNFKYLRSGPYEVPGPQGLPLIKPPFRRITAIDLSKGEHAWQIPFGEGPTQHPALKDLNLGRLGSQFPGGVIAEGGILLTKTLLITILANADESDPERPAKGSFLQAYDKATGELLHSIPVDIHLHGGPMSFLKDGKQYIAVAGGGGDVPGELIAFALK